MRLRLPRAEYVLPALIALSAAVLITSEFMTAFEFTPPGGEVQAEQTAADRHSYAMLVLGVAALLSTAVALRTGSRPAASATAGLGVAALLLFLIIDLPDAGKIGPLEDFITARADAQPGFWLGAVGALGLAVGGGGLATLAPEQLRAPAQRFGLAAGDEEQGTAGNGGAPPGPGPRAEATGGANPDSSGNGPSPSGRATSERGRISDRRG